LKDKLFFYGTFERFTKTDFRLGGFGSGGFVPTTAMLGGDFSALLGSNLCTNPVTGNMRTDRGASQSDHCGTAAPKPKK
jgi:hypothetical protein